MLITARRALQFVLPSAVRTGFLKSKCENLSCVNASAIVTGNTKFGNTGGGILEKQQLSE